MSDLRDLLQEQVADIVAPDLAEAAWDRAIRVRRRRALLSLAGVAATVVVIALLAAVVRGGAAELQPAPIPAPEPDAVVQGVPVWWSPDVAQERELSWLEDSPLPRTLDVAAAAASAPQDRIEQAVAAVGYPSSQRPEWVVLIDPDGGLHRLDVSRLVPWRNVNAPFDLTTRTMLSPDGRHLVFPQDGHLEVVTLATGEWRSIDADIEEDVSLEWLDTERIWIRARTWLGKEKRYRTHGPVVTVGGERLAEDYEAEPESPFQPGQALGLNETGMINALGSAARNLQGAVAQAWGMGGPLLPVPGEGDGRYTSGPAYLTVSGAKQAALAFVAEVDENRSVWGPVVAGWLDDGTVVYEPGLDGRTDVRDQLVAWKVGTSEFHRVMAIEPPDLGTFFGGASFALQATEYEDEMSEPNALADVGATKGEARGLYDDTELWWAPTVEEEAGLPPYVGAPLPATIDLADLASTVDRLDAAVAVFGLGTCPGRHGADAGTRSGR